MWSLLLSVALSSAASGAPSLASLAAAINAAPAWRASFVQRYVPAGFTEGTTDQGVVTIAPPVRLRFEYRGESEQVFAVDGAVVRMVDPGAGTCDALHLDSATWGRLPLAALLDPAAAGRVFTSSARGVTLVLVPHEPMPELAELEVTVGRDGLPATVVVLDGAGNRNEFSFQDWRRQRDPGVEPFRPTLPGQPPCVPDQE
jgi:outer membrane lipoprotein-sorting protein